MSMTQRCSVASIQMVAGTDVEGNLAAAARLVRQAAAQGAQLVVLPEYFVLMGQHDQDKVHIAEPAGQGRMQTFCAELARECKVWLAAGTLPLQSSHPDKVRNSLLVFNAQGEQVCRYDKIHLFGFQKGAESYNESSSIEAGDAVTVLDTPFGRIGLAICYDIRFPELFRQMGSIDILIVPAAFTRTTGQKHWEVLLRARAIENQCFVIASGQGGLHQNGRETFGHSMVIDPWGEVLALWEEGEGMALATLNPERLEEVRSNLPALAHRVLG